MWTAKIWQKDPDCIWATRCKKFSVFNFQYPLGSYEEGGRYAFANYHILEGEEKNIDAYIQDVKKDLRVKKLDARSNYLVSLSVISKTEPEMEAFQAMYNPRLLYLRPGINRPDGSEVWELGSYDRSALVNAVAASEKFYNGKLLFLKRLSVPKIFIPGVMPALTKKQEDAFKLASKSGYYEFPRKTNLEKLAKKMKVSRPTFEEHLRKAEKKLLYHGQE